MIILGAIAAWMWWRIAGGDTPWPHMPQLGPEAVFWLPGIAIILLLALVLIVPMLGNARSPHMTFRPEQIDVGFDDVRGMAGLKAEVTHTLQVLLDHQRFRSEMGGHPRRGVLFEGPPGTGKTRMAKAMAREAGVPFLYVSATAFQSMWYGMTSRRIRRFFREMRKIARREGGVIGFIEEIDAIGLKRGGQSPSSTSAMTLNRAMSTDTGGVVNELLVQMQSFDEPSFRDKLTGAIKDLVNRYLPRQRHLKRRPSMYTNLLLIAATNRSSALDPALLRPGRFDRILHFDLPGRSDRRDLIDYFLASRSHDAALDGEAQRDDLASATLGYTPASLERLFDEALLLALRDERNQLAIADLRRARMEIEIGLPQPLDQPEHERRTIAFHEAGHAVVAYLAGKGRKLEMLSIVKRKEALGFLAHRLQEERHTQTASELVAQLQISLGGMVAEELVFGESGTGPAGDLAAATNIAVEMVGSLGLGGTLISYRALDAGVLGGNLAARVLGDGEGRTAVDSLLNDNKQAVTGLLSANLHLVEALAAALLERHELVDEEILEVLGAAGDPAAVPARTVIDLRSDDPVVDSERKPARFEWELRG